jgi:hypothetical protein
MDIIWSEAASLTNNATLLGKAYDEFMRVWNEYYPEWSAETESPFGTTQEEELFPKVPSRALTMLSWYIKIKRPHIAKYTILGIELPFIVPIPGDEEVFYIGRNDKVYEKEDGRIYTGDHKTTKSAAAAWINTFQPNNQVDGYNYAGLMTYGESYWGVEIDGALCQRGTARTWTDPVYPNGIGFPPHSIMAATGHTEAWLWETTYTIRLLESHLEMLADCRPEDTILMAFDKRTTACGYYSGCIYRNICSYIVNPNREVEPPTGFKEEKWEPFKILDQTKVVTEDSNGE